MAVHHLSPVPVQEVEPESVVGPAAESEVRSLKRVTETVTERVQRLQAEARQLASDQVEALANDITAVAAQAAEIAEGGEAYPAGVRELASRLAEDLPQKVQILLTILHRTARD
jgi:preprotein translocase subunit SecA